MAHPEGPMADAAEMLWVVLANVSGGDWTKQSDEWQAAAARWRDNYFKALGGQGVQMAATNITISGVLFDKLARTTQQVTLVGDASFTGVGVGGGPVFPPEEGPPGIWGPPGPWPTPPIHLPDEPPIVPGLKPEHPIALPPNVPSHPIVIPGDPPKLEIWPPLPNNDLPEPEPQPPNPCFTLVYSLRYGWSLVNLENGKGKSRRKA